MKTILKWIALVAIWVLPITSLAVALAMLTGCDIPGRDNSLKIKGRFTVVYDEATIDGCEYIVTRTGGGAVMTHKGNCHNEEHKAK